MLKRIIGAAIGAKLAKNSPAVGGATGAALGAAVPWVLGRLSIPAMIALAAMSPSAISIVPSLARPLPRRLCRSRYRLRCRPTTEPEGERGGGG